MNRYLLDTNIVLWFFQSAPRADLVKTLIESNTSEVFISPVSWWEIVIKVRSGKLRVNVPDMRERALSLGFKELPLTSSFIQAYLDLPALHKDPFDHILLAQAITAPMRFITGDGDLAAYSSLVVTA
jgi:PIN domain nuclease of toxin-antitoxin system